MKRKHKGTSSYFSKSNVEDMIRTIPSFERKNHLANAILKLLRQYVTIKCAKK